MKFAAKRLIPLIILFILIPVKSFSQDYNNPVLKSVILPYFSSVDSLESDIISFNSAVFSDTIVVKKSNPKWYVKLGRGCLFGTAGAYFSLKVFDKLYTGNDTVGHRLIIAFCGAVIGFTVGWIL